MTIVSREEWRARPIVDVDKLYRKGGHGCSPTHDHMRTVRRASHRAL